MEVKIHHCVATIPAGEYVRKYRDIPKFLGCCQQCPGFGKTWSCPPFDFDISGMFDGFSQAMVFGTQIFFDEDTRAECKTQNQSRLAAGKAIKQAWTSLLPFLYDLESRFAGSRIFVGRCRLCPNQECTRISGLPCRHPADMRHSLESVGFDLNRTAKDLLGIELLWSTDGTLPEYLTLVTALFTRETVAPVLPPE